MTTTTPTCTHLPPDYLAMTAPERYSHDAAWMRRDIRSYQAEERRRKADRVTCPVHGDAAQEA